MRHQIARVVEDRIVSSGAGREVVLATGALLKTGLAWNGDGSALLFVGSDPADLSGSDVYGVAPHVGRGGWTWYTGSSGWMQRVAIETLLGLSPEGGTRLRVAPRVPAGWPGFRVDWTRPGSNTRIRIEATPAAPGEAAGESVFDLPDDGGEHRFAVRYRTDGETGKQTS